MDIEDIEHLRFVVRLLRLAHATEGVHDDQAEVVDQALAAFLKRYDLEPAQAIPLLESIAFAERDR